MKYTPVWAWFTSLRMSCRTSRRSSTNSAHTSVTSAPKRITGSAKKPSRCSVRCCGDIPRRIARGSWGSSMTNSAMCWAGIIPLLSTSKHFYTFQTSVPFRKNPYSTFFSASVASSRSNRSFITGMIFSLCLTKYLINLDRLAKFSHI